MSDSRWKLNTSQVESKLKNHKMEEEKEAVEYKEYLQSQARERKIAEPLKERVQLQRREFVYDNNSIKTAQQHRNKEVYSSSDMDKEFFGCAANSGNKIVDKRKVDVWALTTANDEDDNFDLDAPIAKPRELRPLNLKDQLDNLNKFYNKSN